MQDANVKGWLRETHVSREMLVSVRELNHRFLDLVSRRPDGWMRGPTGWPLDWPSHLAPLSRSQRAAAANCPYALFDLRFQDGGHWRRRLQVDAHWSVADVEVDGDTLEFVRVALFFAWHVASTTKLAAQLLLGMSDATATAFRIATIDFVPAVAVTEAAHLTARWSDCGRYWNALAGAAMQPDSAQLRRIQLHGLQLAAAARLD